METLSIIIENISNPPKYAGEVYDQETGLYYLRARYYDPALGRFINEDIYEGQINNPLSLNLYTYCYNNPLSYIDPTGHTAKDFMMGLVNALDDNLTKGLIRWAVNKIMSAEHSYRYDSEIDYYAGRVVGDVLSIGGCKRYSRWNKNHSCICNWWSRFNNRFWW